MDASTTIKQMLAGNRIFVPAYQRAYDNQLFKDYVIDQIKKDNNGLGNI
ncbi:hypothetical protein [Neptunomonas concharum]|nr:hypothetical protein [Neptunomonas concharum]